MDEVAVPDISIDVTRLVIRAMRGRLPTGVDRVCLSYAMRYGTARAVLHKFGLGKVLSLACSRELFGLLASRPRGLVRKLSTLIARSLPMPVAQTLRPGSILLNVGHSGLDRPAYGRWLRRNQVLPIFMVHDLIPITHPEYCREGERRRHEQRIAAMLGLGAGVIANSTATLEMLRGHADKLRLAMPPAVAAPLAGTLLPSGAATPAMSEPYFVMLGTVEPRKNHALILQAWLGLAERRQTGPVPRLVLIGQRGWDTEHIDRLLSHSDVLRRLVVRRPVCGDAELATWLRHARALLFPSFVEGYGLPLVEALGMGTPVIASDLAVFREIAGDIPDYLDPRDGAGWRDAIADFATAGSRRRALQLERTRHFDPPTWECHYAIVDDLLDQVAGGFHA